MKRLLPYGILAALGVAFRIPAFQNAEAYLSSDTAVVGLQALHLGDQWLLWGTSYQGVIDVWVTAFAGAFTDRPAVALVACGVIAHTLLVLACFRVVRPLLPPAIAYATTALLLFPPVAIHGYTYQPPRIWAFALVFAAIASAEGAQGAAVRWRRLAAFAAAGLLAGLAYYADLFILVFLPGLAVYALCNVAALAKGERLPAIGAIVGGFLLTTVLRIAVGMKGVGANELMARNLRKQFPLFVQCLPGLFGFDSYDPGDHLLRAAGWLGTASAALLAVAGAGLALAALVKWLPSVLGDAAPGPEHRLAICGGSWILVAVAGFLFTRRAYDLGGTRYLNPVLLALPLVMLPALKWLQERGRWRWAFALVLATAVHFTVSGWRTYERDLAYAWPQPFPSGPQSEEQRLFAELRRRGIATAYAGYWDSYRLTLLAKEELIIAPSNGDRYPPYRARALQANPGVVIFHDRDAQPRPEHWEESLRARGAPFERLQVGRFTVMITPEPVRLAELNLPGVE